MSWATEEFKNIDLGDARLNKRTALLAEQLAANPMASIPQACGGWAETQAAYRFLAQDELGWEDILAPHWQSTEARMRAQPVVLCLQDTTHARNESRLAFGWARWQLLFDGIWFSLGCWKTHNMTPRD